MKKIILFMFLLGSVSQAQNLLSNPNFNTGIDGWNIFELSEVSWIADDGVSNSGSLQFSDSLNNGGVGSTGHAPVAIEQGQSYDLSAYFKVIPNTEAQGAAIIVRWLDENQFNTGLSDFYYPSPGYQVGQWDQITAQITPPAGTHYVQIFLGVVTANTGSTDPSVVRWDDVRLVKANASGFGIVPAHTGQWFDPAQSGHGLNVEILPDNKALIIWYVYDSQGNQVWILGTGTHNGQTITVDANITDGAMFPPNFNANDVQLTPWGTFTLTFTGCHAGVFSWNPQSGNGYNSGQMNVTRLTQVAGLECNE
ncbi:MAG: hypothetical protein R3E90_11565 [Marinicella sp.]